MPLAVRSAVVRPTAGYFFLRVHGSFFALRLQHERRPDGVSLRIRRDFPSTAPMMWGLVLHGIELEFADDSL
jgi:hypothetical protein